MPKKSLRALIVLLLLISISSFAKDRKKSKSNEQLKSYVAKLTALKGVTPTQWRVIWTGDAAREATVSWSTAEEGKEHIVYYGEAPQGQDAAKYTLKQSAHRHGSYTLNRADTQKKIAPAFYHHVRLKNLKPATRYYFVMKSDGEVSKQLYFVTAPAKGTDFSIIHGGDSRSGILARCQVNEKIASLVEDDPKIIAFAHGGDYVVKGTWGLWRLWLSQHELTTSAEGRVLPIIPTRGNHDGGPNYKEIFDILPEQPDWYTTRIGKDVAMVTLDTNVPGGGDQSQWLESQLQELRPQSKWLLTQYHRPLYPAVKSVPAHQKIFCPLFDKYNVDLACEADGHCIKRTIPIRGNKADPTGVTYIGEGGLGVGQRKPDMTRWFMKGGISGREHHVMVLGFSEQNLRIQTILLNGDIFDDHQLKRRK